MFFVCSTNHRGQRVEYWIWFVFCPERLERGDPCWLLKRRHMGTYGVTNWHHSSKFASRLSGTKNISCRNGQQSFIYWTGTLPISTFLYSIYQLNPTYIQSTFYEGWIVPKWILGMNSMHITETGSMALSSHFDVSSIRVTTVQTDSVLHVKHDMVSLGFTAVERPEPKNFYTFS